MTIKVSQAVRELYISVLGVPGMEKAMIRQGSYDNTTVMQMLARFEVETRQNERGSIIEMIRTQFDAPHNAKLCGRIMDAIRNLTTRD
jgi:hypothetical protein